MTASLVVRDLGLCDYETVYQLQKNLVERRKSKELEADQLILVEHPDVYTYGRKSKTQFNTGVRSFEIERGGEGTFHCPGQLVCYPILKLEYRDVHLYLRRLEALLVGLLSEFGILAEGRIGQTGVWIKGKEKKIASIGIAVSGWVTYHGIALNVSNDLSGFYKMNPCGFSPTVMTSMKEELGGECPRMDGVKTLLVERCLSTFSMEKTYQGTSSAV